MGEAEAELEAARRARAAGNEGRARVCARRAAGQAIRAYYRRVAGPGWGGDALKQLERLKADAAAPEPVRQAAARLSAVVDFDHRLPFPEDPLEDAQRLIAFAGAG